MITLSSATITALATLRSTWPRAFQIGDDRRDLERYARSLKGCDFACITEAADYWVDHHRFPPTPSEFKDVAWTLHRQKFPAQPSIAVPSQEFLQQQMKHEATMKAWDVRVRFIRGHCGSLREVGEVCALIAELAETPEERQAVRDGEVTKKHVLRALKAHRDGVRSIDHKLALRATCAPPPSFKEEFA